VLDYRDKWGRRRWLSYPLTAEGLGAANADLERLAGSGLGIDPVMTLGRYIKEQWEPQVKQRVEEHTFRAYSMNARVHIPEALKRMRVHEVTRVHIKKFLLTLGQEHNLAPSTVKHVANVMRSIMEYAVDDGLIAANPASELRLSLAPRGEEEKVRAMDAQQFEKFISVARMTSPEKFATFAVMGYAGLRIGEARGLQVEDLDLKARTLRIERQVHDDGKVGPVKGKRGKRRPRTVDVRPELVNILEPWLQARRVFQLSTGDRGPWLLQPGWPVAPSVADASATTHRIRRAMQRILKAARLPDHFTPHSLRHIYCRLLLEAGEDLLYVSRQQGHSSIAITADRYGHYARVKSRLEPERKVEGG